jgi:hypothetical protein
MVLPELKDVGLDVVGRLLDDAAFCMAAPVDGLYSNPRTSAVPKPDCGPQVLNSKGFIEY